MFLSFHFFLTITSVVISALIASAPVGSLLTMSPRSHQNVVLLGCFSPPDQCEELGRVLFLITKGTYIKILTTRKNILYGDRC